MSQLLDLPSSQALVQALVECVAKATVVLTVVLLLAELLRRHHAADRCRLRVAGFAALLLIPIATVLIPDQAVPWLPKWAPADIRVDAISGQRQVLPGTVPSPGAVVASDPTPVDATVPTAWIVMAAWLLGAVVTLVPTALSLAHRHALRHIAPRLHTPEWQVALKRAASVVGFRGEVELITGSGGVAPMTWGSAPAVVLIPTEAATWGEGCREAVLHHELAHAQRRDADTLLWCRLICACYWFHPLVWFAYGRLRVDQELAADEMVLQGGRSPIGYAESLLQVLQGIRRTRLGPGVAAAGRRSELEHRIRSILLDERPRRMVGVARHGLLAIVVLFALAVAPLEPVAQPHPSRATAGFRLNWRLDGRDEEMTLSGRVLQADQLSTLRFLGEGRLVIESRPARQPGAAVDRRLVITGTSAGAAHQEWQRNGSTADMTDEDRAWVNDRLRYLTASLALRDEARLLESARDSLMANGGVLPSRLSESDRISRVRALERISAERQATMRRRDQLEATGAAPWQLFGLDRDFLRLSWAELKVAGVTHP